MILVLEQDDQLLLKYSPGSYNDVHWIDRNFADGSTATIRRIFTFSSNALVQAAERSPWEDEDDARTFILGVTVDNYFKIDRDVLGLQHDLLLVKGMDINTNLFIAVRDISIFRKIDRLIEEPIVIGGDQEGAIPVEEFAELLQNFPTSTELTHYSNARVARVLQDYLGTMSDPQKKLDNYLNRRRNIQPRSRVESLKEFEREKFEFIRESVSEMLADFDSYSEKDWQKIILDFLLLIFPKYVAVLENVHIKDFYSEPGTIKNRYIDLAIVDANGNIDIVELKKPFPNCLLRKRKYRDSYIPKKELVGSVMQVEKYLFHLSKWGVAGEKQISHKEKSHLPPGMQIRITNPKAMIIVGRDNDFAGDQKFDFEIIRRKYANIMDIMTYDDLLRRLDNIISKFSTATLFDKLESSNV